MNVRLFQVYFDKSHYEYLDSAFIPYNNLINPEPNKREYPTWSEMRRAHKNFSGYWGIMSWQFSKKTNLKGHEYLDWILKNPGYDIYHINPYPEVTAFYDNVWTQGERWHPGILKYINKLLVLLGYNFKMENFPFIPNQFSTSNYYVGNYKFWDSWMNFLDYCLDISNQDEELLNYLYNDGNNYNGKWVPYFPFVTERLFTLHNILKDAEFKILKFPYEHECYKKSLGSQYDLIMKTIDMKNKSKDSIISYQNNLIKNI